jgi:hypothetical protein
MSERWKFMCLKLASVGLHHHVKSPMGGPHLQSSFSLPVIFILLVICTPTLEVYSHAPALRSSLRTGQHL